MSVASEREDWFDEGAVAYQATVEPRELLRLIEEFATGPSVAEDPLTRLWRDADDSHLSGAEAVAALREWHRQAEPARRQRRLRRRG